LTAWLLAWAWQGIALVVALSILLHFLPRVNASTRCVIWWGAYAALIWLGWTSSPNTGGPALAAAPATTAVGSGGAEWFAIQVQPLPTWLLTLVLTSWITVALFRLLRILPDLQLLYRLKDECRPFPRAVEHELSHWLDLPSRRVRLMICDELAGAAVLGLQQACIAIPSHLIAAVSVRDLDQIVLHEYAHVQRHDDWMRLLQALVDAALWIHPAALLIGRSLNLEREVACDDWVVSRTGAPRDYAGCLVRAAEARSNRMKPGFAPAFSHRRRYLSRRVDRLLHSERNATARASLRPAAVGIALVCACAVHLSAFPIVTEGHGLAPDAANAPAGAAETDPGADAAGISTRAVERQTFVSETKTDRREISQPEIPQPEIPQPEIPLTTQISTTEDNPLIAASAQEDAPATLAGSRQFQGTYPVAPSSRSGESGGPGGAGGSLTKNGASARLSSWQIAGNAGDGIGAAAKKAGGRLAATFTHAGISLARRF